MNDPQRAPLPLTSISSSQTGLSDFYVHVPSNASPAKSSAAVIADIEPVEIENANYFRFKTYVDRLITGVLILLALPLMGLVAMAILVLDGRPVFYRQVRLGKQGRHFSIWKFRTMRHDAERNTGAVWCSKADPRITPLGRWLRCSHIDELPQFFNILAGEMNLVGPRPERPEIAEELTSEIPGYMQRTTVRPGISGLAQLRLGYDRSVADVRKKVSLDLQYIQTASLSGDLWLLACTVPHVAKQLFNRWIDSPSAASAAQSELDSDLPIGGNPTVRLDHSASGPSAEHHATGKLITPRRASRVRDECA